MSSAAFPIRLPALLRLDAATCVAMGGLLLLAAGPIGALTAIPVPVLRIAGAVLFPIAAFLWLVARHAADRPAAVGAVVLGNAGWVAASLALLALVAPNGLGVAFLLAQALVVALLAWLEYRAFRAEAPAAPRPA